MRLVGIARLAAAGELLEAKRAVEYRELPTRSYLNRCRHPKMPFEWTINPYRGCEYGCRYCYARRTHEFLEFRDPEDFERQIFAKTWSAARFRAELARIPLPEAIAIGTATDPYQPAERRFRVTRKMLEIFAEGRGRTLHLTTKSDAVAQDAELLARVGERNRVLVNMTVTTMDAALARSLEPQAPHPELRMKAVAGLARAGLAAGVFASPVIPGLNDGERALGAVAEAAARAGAQRFSAQMLFLNAASRPVFAEWLRRHHPQLVHGLDRRSWAEQEPALRERLRKLRERFGLEARAPVWTPPQAEQMGFFDILT